MTQQAWMDDETPRVAGRAVVTGLEPTAARDDQSARPLPRLWLDLDGQRVRATWAVAGATARVGDEVVVVGDGEDRFVVGLISPRPTTVALRCGARAEVDEHGRLEVRDESGTLCFRFDGENLHLSAGEGDLVLEAPEGGVRLRSRDDVTLEAGRDLVQRATRGLRQEALRVDVIADQLFERTRDSVREAAGLMITRAGRLKTRVRESITMRAKRTNIKSDKDTAIDGQRVLLG